MGEIIKIDIKSKKRIKQNTLRVTLIARVTYTFLKNGQPNIIWAKRPIVNLMPERQRKKRKMEQEYYDTIKIHMPDMTIQEYSMEG